MPLDENQVSEMKRYYPNIATVDDGGITFILIRALLLPADCKPSKVDALLCPSARDGYTSRLFLSEKIEHHGPGQNWNADGVLIAGQKWWAVSWKLGKESQRLIGMVIAHLSAFRCK
jgi:hypothetical protein